MSSNAKPRRRRDHRLTASLMVVAMIGVFGLAVKWLPGFDGFLPGGSGIDAQPAITESSPFPFLFASAPDTTERREDTPSDPATNPRAHAERMRDAELQRLLAEAQKSLDSGRYGEAVPPLTRAMTLSPYRPEPYVNMGYAQLGMGNLTHANKAFMHAIDLKPNEAKAYFGLGIVFDQMREFESALGAMRSFLHLTQEKDAFNPTVTRARSAIWEWESRLGRGPWGPTRGIPPGLTEKDVQRDGTGIGMLEPQPDGTSRARTRPPETTGISQPK